MTISNGASAMTLDEMLDAAEHEQGMANIAYANAQVHWQRRIEFIRRARGKGASIGDIADALCLTEKYVADLLRR